MSNYKVSLNKHMNWNFAASIINSMSALQIMQLSVHQSVLYNADTVWK